MKQIFKVIILVHFLNISALPLVIDQDVEQLEDLNGKLKMDKLEMELQKLRQELQRLSNENSNSSKPANQNATKVVTELNELKVVTDSNVKAVEDSGDDGVFGTFYDYPVVPSVRRIEKRQEGWVPMTRAEKTSLIDENSEKQKMIDAVENHIIQDLNDANANGIELQAILNDLQRKKINLQARP